MTIRYASVCSGIEAPTSAWHPLGWTPAWFSEIAPFPCAVLAHHYPTVPNLGDMTRIGDADLDRAGAIDLLVGGTPCQSFSVAGLRRGLADPRGNLALEFLRLLDRTRARWVVWENVPGVLSSAGGRDFGSFLGALGDLGYGWSYRVLDAQHFGLAQRRKRVFVVGHLGDWRRAAAVLFESEGLRGDPPPRREAGAVPAHAVTAGAGGSKFGSGRSGQDDFVVSGIDDGTGKGVSRALANVGGGNDPGANKGATLVVAHAYRKSRRAQTNTDDETWVDDGKANTLNGFDVGDVRTTHAVVAPTFVQPVSDPISAVEQRRWTSEGCAFRTVNVTAYAGAGVRRLTPRECERLQGFPDDWTLVPYRNKPAADGPRYQALGNSMAVPVVRWIGERIAAVEGIP